MLNLFLNGPELNFTKIFHIDFDSNALHVSEKLSKRKPIFSVQLKVIDHVFFICPQLTQLFGESLTQKVSDLSIKTGVFDPLGDVARICVHFLDVREHKDFTRGARLQLLVETESLHNVYLFSLAAVGLV